MAFDPKSYPIFLILVKGLNQAPQPISERIFFHNQNTSEAETLHFIEVHRGQRLTVTFREAGIG